MASQYSNSDFKKILFSVLSEEGIRSRLYSFQSIYNDKNWASTGHEEDLLARKRLYDKIQELEYVISFIENN